MDLANALYVVLAVLISLILADLILFVTFALMDALDPTRIRSGLADLSARFGQQIYEASDLWSHARHSRD